MTGGFYELLGIEPTSSAARVRSAYGQALSRIAKQRRVRQDQAESVDSLDLERAKLDEAWAVLSDPMRRRRYDALLQWQQGSQPTNPDAVWALVGESLVHPAASVATRLLRVTSQLGEIGELPRPPSGSSEDPATLIPHDDDLTTPRDRPSLKVVDGGTEKAGVIMFPQQPRVARRETLPDDEIEILVEQHDYSGELLRAVRERMGLTLRAVADRTRISEMYLAALEAESPDRLPSATFVRGYVRLVANALGLPADEVVPGYMRRHKQTR